MSDADAELEDIRRRVEAVLENDRNDADPEGAHLEEDRLYREVLKATVNNHPHHQQMAREVLRLEESEGSRWYS